MLTHIKKVFSNFIKAKSISNNILSLFIIITICVFACISNPPVYQIFKVTHMLNESVKFAEFTTKPLCLLIFTYFVTGFLGYGLIYSMVSDIHAPKLTKIFAGFLFGYVGILFPARIITFYLTGINCYISIICVSLTVGFFSIKNYKPQNTHIDSANKYSSSWINELYIIIFAIFFVISALLLQVEQGEFAWVGHGTNQYAYLLKEWTQMGMKHFPLIFQHYDELLYHFFATIFYINDFDSIIPWWFTLALIKLSIVSFIYLFFRKLKIDVKSSLVFCLFIILGTSSVLLFKYYLLFDASNPLFFTVHSGRIVGIGVVLYIILMFLTIVREEDVKTNYFTLVFLGFGIAGTSLSNAAWVIMILTLLCFIKKEPFLLQLHKKLPCVINNDLSFLSIIPIIIIVLILIQPFSNKLISQHKAILYLFIYLISMFYCTKLLVNYWRTLHAKDCNNNFKNILPLLIFIATTIISLAFFGNIISFQIYKNFPNFANMFLHEIPPQLISTGSLVEDVDWKWGTLLGDYREFGHYLYNNVYEFIAYYSIFLIACMSCYILLKNRMLQIKFFNTEDRILLIILLFSLIVMPGLFIFMNYLAFGSRAWIKSRFIEIPIYLIICICLYFANRFLKKKELSILLIGLIIYSITPFFATQRPIQMLKNANLIRTSITPKVNVEIKNS